MAKPKSLVDLKKSGENENLGNFKSLAQKIAFEKNHQDFNKKQKLKGKIKTQKLVKSFLETNDIKKAAKEIGVSRSQASRYLHSEQADAMFKEIFKEIGVDKAKLAKIAFNEFLEYNRQKVTKIDEKGREVEEMRDGRLAFKSLQFIADKLESSKSEIEINHNINISDNTASLAIKQLINKIDDVEILQELKALVENKIANTAKIVDIIES
jgi:transcriptional regulator with XRE-family HTH domain